MSPFCGATGTLCFGLRLTLRMSCLNKVRNCFCPVRRHEYDNFAICVIVPTSAELLRFENQSSEEILFLILCVMCSNPQ